MKQSLSLLLTSLLPLFLSAQSTFIPLHTPAYHTLDRIEIKSDSIGGHIHSSVKPYNRFHAVLTAEAADDVYDAGFRTLDRQSQYYIYTDNNEWTPWGLVKSKKPFLKQFYQYKPDFFYLNLKDEFTLKVNPVLYLQFGKELNADGIRLINTRGIEVRGLISEKLGFYSYLSENQASYMSYVHRRTNRENAVPGEGRFKPYNSRIGNDLFAPGVDFFSARGYITFQPIPRIRVTFGHDKHFIGNGLRSMLLSDFSNNMLFLKINTKVWKLNYQNLFMELTEQFEAANDSLRGKKYAAIHHLSFNIGKRANIGFFESVIFDRANGFELQYLNPIIFYRAVEFHLGSADNVILGMDFKVNFARHFSLYGQVIIDEWAFDQLFSGTGWWGNKYGFQAGLKYVDVAGVSHLDAQVEFNIARPFTYTHHNSQSNYTHFNQPLAHPLGANFREVLGIVRYKPRKNLDLKLNILYAQKGQDIDTLNYGGNILLDSDTRVSNVGNVLLQGNQTDILMADLGLSYMWKHNVFFDLTYTYRQQTDALNVDTHTDHYMGLGMRVNIARKELLY